jgi:two-component system, chemotaxis family, chemotaxis protein CheY
MRMMIVDDSNMIRSRIANIVQAGGIKGITLVGLAKDGREAVRAAKSTKPEVVTMDITMPNMDGLSCIQALMDMDPNVSILVVSALNDKSTAIAAMKFGARGFVGKPFTDDELRLALLDLTEA